MSCSNHNKYIDQHYKHLNMIIMSIITGNDLEISQFKAAKTHTICRFRRSSVRGGILHKTLPKQRLWKGHCCFKWNKCSGFCLWIASAENMLFVHIYLFFSFYKLIKMFLDWNRWKIDRPVLQFRGVGRRVGTVFCPPGLCCSSACHIF